MDGRLPFMLLGVVNGLRNDQLTAAQRGDFRDCKQVSKASPLSPITLLYEKVSIFTKNFNTTKNVYSFNNFRTEMGTVFENDRKSLIQHCERSELRLHFEWTKVN